MKINVVWETRQKKLGSIGLSSLVPDPDDRLVNMWSNDMQLPLIFSIKQSSTCQTTNSNEMKKSSYAEVYPSAHNQPQPKSTTYTEIRYSSTDAYDSITTLRTLHRLRQTHLNNQGVGHHQQESPQRLMLLSM